MYEPSRVDIQFYYNFKKIYTDIPLELPKDDLVLLFQSFNDVLSPKRKLEKNGSLDKKFSVIFLCAHVSNPHKIKYVLFIQLQVVCWIISNENKKNRQLRTTCSYFCSREIKKKTETAWHATLTRQKKITNALAFKALLFLVLIDVGGYIRSPNAIPAVQDLRVLVDSHLMLSKHVKVHMTRNFFDCFGIIIVWSIYFSIFRQFHWKLTILWACKNWVFAWKLWYSNRAAKVPRDLDCDVVLVANSQTQHKIWQS